MYQAGDVRVENVPDPVLREPTDAIVRVTSACICGSDLWPYQSMSFKENGRATSPSPAAQRLRGPTSRN